MRVKLPVKLFNSLTAFNSRALVHGEVFLLSKAIADTLPLPEAGMDNIVMHNLRHKNYINMIIDELYNFCNISNTEDVYRLVNELSLWRYNIAYSPPSIFFKGDVNYIIDEMTCITRYVDMSDLCSVADIVSNANHLYSTFKELAMLIKNHKVE